MAAFATSLTAVPDSPPASQSAASIVDAADRFVVARARAGDREAFSHLHAKFAPLVHAIVISHAPIREAPDLMQEVFTRALSHISNLRDDDRAGPWLATIARHVAQDFIRRRRATSPLPDSDAFADPRSPVSSPSLSSSLLDAQQVLESIRALPETYRETIAMRLVEGMTGPEIAERTGMTHGSVRVHLHRGMQLLTESLARRGLTRD